MERTSRTLAFHPIRKEQVDNHLKDLENKKGDDKDWSKEVLIRSVKDYLVHEMKINNS